MNSNRSIDTISNILNISTIWNIWRSSSKDFS